MITAVSVDNSEGSSKCGSSLATMEGAINGSSSSSSTINNNNNNNHNNRKRSLSASSSGSSDSSASDSSSSSSRDQKHRKEKKEKRLKKEEKLKKEKKHKKEEKHKKHKKDKKHKKEKKHEKDKKHKKEKKHEKEQSKGAVDQNFFGKYGIIREDHYFGKQREFEVYMEEVKSISVASLGKRDIQIFFKDFIEDFNTATMKHEKYYNLEKWEMEEYRRKQLGLGSSSSSGEYVERAFNDEEERRNELKLKKQLEEQREMKAIVVKMSQDKTLMQDMRNKDILHAELNMAFKTGDSEKVKKLVKLLEPEEEKDTKTGGGWG